MVEWNGTVVLTTPRLVLRTFRRDDLPEYAALYAHPEVFFLDEATAFAAGHRPCALCRRERHAAPPIARGDTEPGTRPATSP